MCRVQCLLIKVVCLMAVRSVIRAQTLKQFVMGVETLFNNVLDLDRHSPGDAQHTSSLSSGPS